MNENQGPSGQQSTYSARWGRLTYISAIRNISAQLILSENPGTAISATDFLVQRRFGTTGSYTWITDTAWTFNQPASSTRTVIIARSSTAPTNGTYRFVLRANAFGTGKPAADVVSGTEDITTGATVPVVGWTEITDAITGASTINGSWSRALTRTSFTASDITVSAGTISNFTFASNNQDFSFTLTPPTNSGGIITITIAANSVTPANTAPQSTVIPYRTIPNSPYDTITSPAWPGTGPDPGPPAPDPTVANRLYFHLYDTFYTGPGNYNHLDSSLGNITLSDVYDPASTIVPDQSLHVGLISLADNTDTFRNPDEVITSGLFTISAGTIVSQSNDEGGDGEYGLSFRPPTNSVGLIEIRYINRASGYVFYYPYDTRNRPTITVDAPTSNFDDRTISWRISWIPTTITGIDFADIINRVPSDATVSVTGSGASRTITLGGFDIDDSGIASFSIRENAFDWDSLPSGYGNNRQVDVTGAYNFEDESMAGPSVIDWDIPTGVQTGNFNVVMQFSENIDLRTTSQTATSRLDNRASQSNADLHIGGTGATGVFFNTITSVGGSRTNFTVPIRLPANSNGVINLVLDRNAVARPGTTILGPITSQTSPSIEYDTRTAPPTPIDGPSVDFDLPDGIQTGTTFDIDADFKDKDDNATFVTGLLASDLTLTGITGATAIVLSQQYNLTLTASSGATLPSRLTPANITINQTNFSGVVVPGTVTRQGTTAVYNLFLNRAVNVGTFATSDITLNNLPNISVSSIDAHSTSYTIRVRPPTNSEGTLSVILERNSVTDGNNRVGPVVSQNSGSVGFNTKTEVVSIVAEAPIGTRVARIPNTPTSTHFRITFNRVLPTDTFDNTDFSAVLSAGVALIGNPRRGTTTTQWFLPVAFPKTQAGSAYIVVNEDAGSTNLTAFQSDIYEYGIEPEDEFEAGPSIVDWIIPQGIQTGNFNVEIVISDDIQLRTATETGLERLDNRASASNEDLSIVGTGAQGVAFGEITAKTS